MRKKVYLSMAFVLAFESTLFAQVTAPSAPSVAVVAGAGGGTTSQLYPGEYGSTNFSAVMETMLKGRIATQKEDREYLKAIGTRIGEAIRSLIAKKQAFERLSQQSQTTVNVTLDSYLTQMNDINALIAQIKLDIEQSSLINSTTLPSYAMSVDGRKVDAGPGSLIDMTAALKGFGEQTAELVAQMDALKFPKLAHKGFVKEVTTPNRGTALAPDLSQFPSMTQEEIDAAILKVNELSVISAETARQQRHLNDLTVRAVKTYMSVVGTEKFLNIRNDNDLQAAQEAAKTLEKHFFMRSYLRKKYGLQIGAIQATQYPQKNVLNFKDWFSKEALMPVQTALNSVISQSAKTDADLMRAFDNARQFVEMYDRLDSSAVLSDQAEARRVDEMEKIADKNASFMDKLKAGYRFATASFAQRSEILGKKPVILDENQRNVAYNSNDTGIMARMSSLFIKGTGQKSTVEALLVAMRYVLADIREEVMLSQGDLSSLQIYHQQRFMGTNQMKIKAIKNMCDYDKSLSADTKSALVTKIKEVRGSSAEDRAFADALGVRDNFTCGQASTGLLAQQRTGAGNFSSQINLLMDAYQRREISRAQQARNLRQIIDSSLAANAQDGDQVDDSSALNGL